MGELSRRQRGALARIGTWTASCGLVAGAFSFAAAALPLRLGVAPAITQMVVAVHTSAALTALGLSLLLIARPQRVIGWLSHPVVMAFFGIAAWSVVAAPFVEYPWGSLLGSEYFGEGALLYLDVAVFVAASAMLVRDRRVGRVILAAGLASSVSLPLLFRFLFRAEWITGQILVEFLAAFALTAPVFAWGLMSPVMRRRWAPAALLAAAPALLIGTNTTAWIAVLAIGVPTVLTAWRLHAAGGSARRLRLLSSLAMPAVLLLISSAALTAGAFGLWESLTSRFNLMKVVWSQIADQPSIWLVGQGWGRTPSTVNAHLNAAGVNVWDGKWDATVRLFIHSHNHAVELLLGAGLPAVVLGVFALAAVAGTVRRGHAAIGVGFVLATAAFLSSWFLVAGNWPALAMAIGAVIGAIRPRRSVPRSALTWVPMAALACQIAALVWLIDLGMAYRRYLHGPVNPAPAGVVSCADVPDDRIRGGDALEHATRLAAFPLFGDLRQDRPVDDARIARFIGLLCRIDLASETIRTPSLITVPVVLRSHLATDPKLDVLRQRMPGMFDEWAALLKRYLDVAPHRSDIASAYIEWELRQGNLRTAMAVARAILQRDGRDPVGLWYSGLVMLAANDPLSRPEALSLMRRALAGGLERRIPINADVVRAIQSGG